MWRADFRWAIKFELQQRALQHDHVLSLHAGEIVMLGKTFIFSSLVSVNISDTMCAGGLQENLFRGETKTH